MIAKTYPFAMKFRFKKNQKGEEIVALQTVRRHVIELKCLMGLNPVNKPPWRVSDPESADYLLGLRLLVAQSLDAPELWSDAAESYSQMLQTIQFGNPLMSIRWHAQRIAHLMRYGWSDAIQIECYGDGFFVDDGNHRLAAAMLLQRENVLVEIRGQADHLDHFLAVLNQKATKNEEVDDCQPSDFVQSSVDGKTVWVHAMDGSTVGRFDWRFGMDVHTTVKEQLSGSSQCLHCTHTAPTEADWQHFRQLIWQKYGTYVAHDLCSKTPIEDAPLENEETLVVEVPG